MADTIGKIEVVIKGGKPWGFRLQSISENRSTITITEILPGGKADLHGKLKVGDNIIKINGIQCLSVEDALQLIESAFRTLTILVWRPSHCSEAIVSYGFKVKNSYLSSQDGKSLSDCYTDESSPIYENLQDLSCKKVQNDTNLFHGYDLENSLPNSQKLLVSLLHNNSLGTISGDTSPPLASSESYFSSSKIQWKKEFYSRKQNHISLPKLPSGLDSKSNFIDLQLNAEKEGQSFKVECDNSEVGAQTVNKQKEKRNSLKSCTENISCIYPNCQNERQVCTKHSPPERDSMKHNFKQIMLNKPIKSSYSEVSNKILHNPISNSIKSKNDVDFPVDLDPSSINEYGALNSPMAASKMELNNMNIYSNISELNDYKSNYLNENNCHLPENIPCQTFSKYSVTEYPDINSMRTVKENSFSSAFSSNKKILSTNTMNKLNQKNLYANQIYSNVVYSNLKNNIQIGKNNFPEISFQNITKDNLNLDCAAQMSDISEKVSKICDEKNCDKIVNMETNACVDNLSNVSNFSHYSNLKNLLSIDISDEKCLKKGNFITKNNAWISVYENTPLEIHSASKNSENKFNAVENSLCTFKNFVPNLGDSLKKCEFLEINSNPSDASFFAQDNADLKVLTESKPSYENIPCTRASSFIHSSYENIPCSGASSFTPSNYENIPCLAASSFIPSNYENIPCSGASSFIHSSYENIPCSGASSFIPLPPFNSMQQDQNLVQSKSTSCVSQNKNFGDETLYMFYNKSSISKSIYKYSSISPENNQGELDKNFQLFNINLCPEDSPVFSGRQTPPLPPPPGETETEIFENDTPLPPPPFPHDLKLEHQSDSQVVQAVYANIEMLRVECSLVSSATQTTLQRKENSKIEKFPGLQLVSEQLQSIEGRESSFKKNNEVPSKLQDEVRSSQNFQKPKKNVINLPLTSPYFTTSVPKAKLLTQHTLKFEEKNFPIVEELSDEKEVLIDSITKKLQILKQEKDALEEELEQNEELGKNLSTKLEELATESETRKFYLYVEELEKITNLLLSLSGRLARIESALLILPTESTEEKEVLQDKYKKLSQQYDEAIHLQGSIEKRNKLVSLFLGKYFSRDELIDYEHFVHMKVKLLVDYKELIEKIKLGEEQLYTLKGNLNGEDSYPFDYTVS